MYMVKILNIYDKGHFHILHIINNLLQSWKDQTIESTQNIVHADLPLYVDTF